MGLGIPGHQDAQHLIVQVIIFMFVSWHGGEGRTLCWFACCVATPWVRRFHGLRFHCTVGTKSAMIKAFRRSTQNKTKRML
jgi:hypothetical protein